MGNLNAIFNIDGDVRKLALVLAGQPTFIKQLLYMNEMLQSVIALPMTRDNFLDEKKKK